MYQFFQYKEELRTAKISATVIVVAFICWGPFFLNLALLTLLGPSSDGLEGFDLKDTIDLLSSQCHRQECGH